MQNHFQDKNIYVMRCEISHLCYEVLRVPKEYIGETGDYLRYRVIVHRQQSRDTLTRKFFVNGHIKGSIFLKK